MCRLQWDLGCITVAHFIDMLSTIGILYENDKYVGGVINSGTVQYIRSYMDFFLCLSMISYKFSTFKPSIQASAIVYATRKAVGIRYEFWME